MCLLLMDIPLKGLLIISTTKVNVDVQEKYVLTNIGIESTPILIVSQRLFTAWRE